MNTKTLPVAFSVAILLAAGGQVHARHVTHPVTPANIDKQPFSFTVNIRGIGDVKEVEIIVKRQKGKPGPVVSAWGRVAIAPSGQKKAAFPALTRVELDGVQTYTFRVSAAELDRTSFTFTETPEDVRVPFPYPGDYWVFNLSDFVSKANK